ncbi:MAG: hypothetical protein Q7R43_01740 [Candidatus Daviesbacteria bacterium]|nr:hypothetical protein [Candidatus Daviesbacteria bacterium]
MAERNAEKLTDEELKIVAKVMEESADYHNEGEKVGELNSELLVKLRESGILSLEYSEAIRWGPIRQLEIGIAKGIRIALDSREVHNLGSGVAEVLKNHRLEHRQ